MFGGLSNILTPATLGPPPKNVPPPTPVILPNCNPQSAPEDRERKPSLVCFLQSINKPSELNESHFAALGVHVHTDVQVEDILPDPSYLPAASGWDGLTVDGARAKDSTFRRPLSNGNQSPEARVYTERRNELSTNNQCAFRTIRRIKPSPGVTAPRLGNCYEFFRQLELMATYWEDTSLPPPTYEDEKEASQKHESPPAVQPPCSKPVEASIELVEQFVSRTTATESSTRSEPAESSAKAPQRVTYRTAPGSSMPAEFRHNLITAFVKLVSYDFGCNVSAPRVEPRLHLLQPQHKPPDPKSRQQLSKPCRTSYFPSGCVFLYRIPTTRELARGGYVEGPLAAVSARNTTNFSSPTDHTIDFGRELVAVLVTAQLRAREGRQEKRFGEGKWWANAKRWGGGEGGPIGREIEGEAGVVGDKDVKPSIEKGNGNGQTPASRSKSPSKPISPSSGLPMRGSAPKKARKNLTMYDNYRMIRLPSSNWDKKTKYCAIGRQKGSDYDDIFVVSSLFHHVCILRARVPDRLLEVLAGGDEEKGEEMSWGKLEMWRSKWFDLFMVEERLEALRLLWGVAAWLSRRNEEAESEDVVMKGT